MRPISVLNVEGKFFSVVNNTVNLNDVLLQAMAKLPSSVQHYDVAN